MAKSSGGNETKKSHTPPAPKERWPADFKAAGIKVPANPRSGCNPDLIGRSRKS